MGLTDALDWNGVGRRQRLDSSSEVVRLQLLLRPSTDVVVAILCLESAK